MKKIVWLLLGLVLGIAIGTGYAWVIRPSDFRGAEPASLFPVYRGEYILLIASAYEAGGDLGRARTRITLFPELNPDSLAELAQQVVAAQGATNAARGLARLSVVLREQTPSAQAPGGTANPVQTVAARYTPTLEPTLAITMPALPTLTQRPAATLSPTIIPEFTLASKEQLCNPEISSPIVQVLVKSADGRGVAGIEIRIQWEGGQDRFLTGMKPELSPGYADFKMETGKTYQVSIGDGMTVVPGLSAPQCPAGGSTFSGSWRLVFTMH